MQGILFVSHGTIHPVIRRNMIDDFAGAINDRFEDSMVVTAFTSGDVRTFIRKRDGEKIRDIRASLLNMKAEGVTDAVVISTHVIENSGYISMREQVNSCAPIFHSIRIARPLLDSDKDAELFARAAYSAFSDEYKNSNIVFLLSGEKNCGNEILESLDVKLKKILGNNSYVVTIHGKNRIGSVLREMKKIKETCNNFQTDIKIIPLSFINKGTIGEEEEKKIAEYDNVIASIKDAGYSVDEISDGLGEFDEFQRLYMRHLYDSLRD